MSPMTNALISYWRGLPEDSVAARRARFEQARDAVRSGHSCPQDLVPYALADVDDAIVGGATIAYLDAAGATPAARPRAVADAVEWIRRGLALNRGAVFAAVLATGHAAACERLAALRLTLATAEVTTICRLLPGERSRTIVRFLHEWLELLDGSAEQELCRQHEQLAAAVHGARRRVA